MLQEIRVLLRIHFNQKVIPPCEQSDGQADFSFEDVLAFVTGADRLPPLGFPRLISLRFYSQVGIYQISRRLGDMTPLLKNVADCVDCNDRLFSISLFNFKSG